MCRLLTPQRGHIMMPPMYLLYEAFFYLVFVFFIPWYVAVGIIRGKPRFLRERLGFYRDKPSEHDIWIHAVSVGEVTAARAVVDCLLELRPGTRIVLTTTTVTGQMTARRLFPGITIAHYPYDMSWVVHRFLRQYRPRVYATMETEIWPTVSRIASAAGLRMLLANGRISDHSLPRYKMIRFMLKRVLGDYEVILARDEDDRLRFIEIGARADQVELGGNVKFDFEADERPLVFAERFEDLAAGRPAFVLGSTVEGEDERLAGVIGEITREGVFVVVAPRKPERFDDVGQILTGEGLRWARRTEIDHVAGEIDVLLLDTIGELPKVYRYATVAFIGGSLVTRGGHNPIEPAAVGTPVAFGPHMENFREVAATLLEMNAAVQVATPAALKDFVIDMVNDPVARRGYSERGLEAVLRNRGAAARTAKRIVDLLG